VEVFYDEGLANHIGPEPCGGLREEADEKSVGGHVGGVLRRESCLSRAPTLVGEWKATSRHTIARVGLGLCAVSDPQHACTLLARELGELRTGHVLVGWSASGRANLDADDVRA
jgi:hypothetical protein